MCGIMGAIRRVDAVPAVLDGLTRLEYRRYDSAGIATLAGGHIERRRARGTIARLKDALAARPLAERVSIGHTRWATHGAPSEANAHPVATDLVALVHNGIIENHRWRGVAFETDTEVVTALLTRSLKAERRARTSRRTS